MIMKRLQSILWTALSAVLLCACTGGTNEVPDPGGKTFYSTTDEYSETDSSRVWFGKDGSFVLTDNFYEGYYEMTGTWSLKENVITLNVESTGVGNFTKVLFEIEDEKTITLQTSLAGSQNGDIFTTDKPSGGSSGPLPTTTPSAKPEEVTSTYYNASRKGFGQSQVQFYPDMTFEFTEVQGMGAERITRRFGVEGEMLIFSNFDEPLYNSAGEQVWNLEMEMIDDNTLVLRTDLKDSRYGDIFTLDGELPENAPGIQTAEYDRTFIHTPIPDTSEQFYPQLELFKDGTFVFTENCYAGMAHYRGFWHESEDGFIVCDVTDNTEMQGFAGQDVTLIYFEYAEPNTLMLDTDLCMSRSGDTFNLDSVK